MEHILCRDDHNNNLNGNDADDGTMSLKHLFIDF